MLHILNKAWADIIYNQAKNNSDKIYLFVTTNDKEAVLAFDREEILPNIFVTSERNMMIMMDRVNLGEGKMPMFEDILISHKIHDVFLKDFLGRHCKRKCC